MRTECDLYAAGCSALLGVTQEQEILVIMDEVEMVRGDQKVKPLVKDILTESGYQWKEIVLKGDKNGQVHPDFETIEQILPHLHENCAIVSVGSGVVTDLSKHSSFCGMKSIKKQDRFHSCLYDCRFCSGLFFPFFYYFQRRCKKNLAFQTSSYHYYGL